MGIQAVAKTVSNIQGINVPEIAQIYFLLISSVNILSRQMFFTSDICFMRTIYYFSIFMVNTFSCERKKKKLSMI